EHFSLLHGVLTDKFFAEELEEFILQNKDINPADLRLKYYGRKGDTNTERAKIEFFILQLECRRKFSKKLCGVENLVFPSLIAGEQASNALIASFHASLVNEEKSFMDMTAGLGIDFMMMARKISPTGANCLAIEMDKFKSECLEVNLIWNNLIQAKVESRESISYLHELYKNEKKIDLIYVDPARRSETGARLYDPSDCSPDIISNRNLLLSVGGRILIKNSPMLDITRCMELYPDAVAIYVVSYKNECKEILADVRSEGRLEKIIVVDVIDTNKFTKEEFTQQEMRTSYKSEYAKEDYLIEAAPSSLWLYEPSAGIMKTGAWNELAERYNLIKCSPNCHLFLSDIYIKEFPGKKSIIRRCIHKQEIKDLKGEKRNVVTRNYPIRSEQLAKKLKIIPGGDTYIYGLTTGIKERPVLVETVAM
ncbi:MAG: hypothetical protein K2J15_07275, partial [Muribaculaceae bacterium]|nr:hypothetical protein [Muribaculaceae bacterium]